MRKYLILSILLSTSIALISCSDDDKKPEPSECSDNQTKCEDNKEYVCKNGDFVFSKDCSDGCDNKGCKVSAEKCTENDTKCEDNKEYVCKNGDFVFSKNCPDGCDNKGCKVSAEKCTDNDTKCEDNKEYICENNAYKLSQECTNGCNGKVCKIDPCKDVKCSQGTCDRGVCITDEMYAMKKNTPCDPDTFVEFCRYDDIATCTQNDDGTYTTDLITCLGRGECAMLDFSDGLLAFCTGENTEKCTEEGERFFYCDVDNLGPFEAYYECNLTNEGTFALLESSQWNTFADCDAQGCNANKEHCINRQYEYYCEYQTKCMNGELSICTVLDDGSIDINQVSCENQTCTTIQGIDDCRTQCSEINQEIKECLSDSELGIQTCLKDDNSEHLYYDISGMTCANGCQNNQCL